MKFCVRQGQTGQYVDSLSPVKCQKKRSERNIVLFSSNRENDMFLKLCSLPQFKRCFRNQLDIAFTEMNGTLHFPPVGECGGGGVVIFGA